MTPSPRKTLHILQLTDGKPGHENQTKGLIQALEALQPVQVETLTVKSKFGALLHPPRPQRVPSPDLLLAAGSRTHLALLRCRQKNGGKAVVLMKPWLPQALFDACIIPAHDAPRRTDNVFVSEGALNTMSPEGEHADNKALILLGGPSRHYRWDTQRLQKQILTITSQDTGTRFLIAGSRRTPAQTLDMLTNSRIENADIVPADQTAPGWLKRQLAASARCWVTPDSVSMLYEALSAGVAVGLLSLEQTSKSRVAAGVARMVSTGQVRTYEEWLSNHTLPSNLPLNEAAKCAQWILDRWPSLSS